MDKVINNKTQFCYDATINRYVHIDEFIKGHDCRCCDVGCREEMVALRGQENTHAFRHKHQTTCNHKGMTKWHYDHQNQIQDYSKNIVLEKRMDGRIADAYSTNNNCVIEFQHSSIDVDAILRSEHYLDRVDNIVWLFDVIEKGHFINGSNWIHKRNHIINLFKKTKSHVFLELEDKILKIESIDDYDKETKMFFKFSEYTTEDFLKFATTTNTKPKNKYHKFISTNIKLDRKKHIELYLFFSEHKEQNYFFDEDKSIYEYLNNSNKNFKYGGGVILNRTQTYTNLLKSKTIKDYLDVLESERKEKERIIKENEKRKKLDEIKRKEDTKRRREELEEERRLKKIEKLKEEGDLEKLKEEVEKNRLKKEEKKKKIEESRKKLQFRSEKEAQIIFKSKIEKDKRRNIEDIDIPDLLFSDGYTHVFSYDIDYFYVKSRKGIVLKTESHEECISELIRLNKKKLKYM